MENHLGRTWISEAIELGMNISGVQNVEGFVSQEMKKYRQNHLLSVSYNRHRGFLRLYFSTQPSKNARNYVKQVSKRKHKDLKVFLEEQRSVIDEDALLATVELPNVYLLFFSEYAK